MEDDVGPPLVILLALSVAIVSHFVYFEISYLVRKGRKKPHLIESLAVSAAVSMELLIYSMCGGSGESGLTLIGFVGGFISRSPCPWLSKLCPLYFLL